MESSFQNQRFYNADYNFCLHNYQSTLRGNSHLHTNVTYYQYKCELTKKTIFYGFSGGLLVEVLDCPIYDFKQRWIFDYIINEDGNNTSHMNRLYFFSYEIQIQNHRSTLRFVLQGVPEMNLDLFAGFALFFNT